MTGTEKSYRSMSTEQRHTFNILDFVTKVDAIIYKKDQAVFKEGDDSDGFMYFVLDGVCILTREDTGDAPVLEMRQGDFFGEMALLNRKPRSGTVKVHSPTARIGRIDREMFIKLSRVDAEFLFQILRVCISRLTALEKEVTRLYSEESGGAV